MCGCDKTANFEKKRKKRDVRTTYRETYGGEGEREREGAEPGPAPWRGG